MNIQELKQIIESSHLNFLIGSGASTPFLSILGGIENRLTNEKRKNERIKIKKEYFKKVIIPNLDITEDKTSGTRQLDLKKTIEHYKEFFEIISSILLKRKSTILSKQVNIFTTNIDILMETVLERSNLEYNDGFSGRLNSIFSLSNFKKSIYKRSLHFENISEIPIFNLIKIHGSLTWQNTGKYILFSKLKHFDRSWLDCANKTFEGKYKTLSIVNPEKEKFEKTVIDLEFYELLRMYSSELEKENCVLFVIGFSMEDEHIREITLRVANSNPTLKIFIFCHKKNEVKTMKDKIKLSELKYSNIELVEPEDNSVANKYTFQKINQDVFRKVLDSISNEEKY